MNPQRFFIPSYMGMRNIPMTGSMFNMTSNMARNSSRGMGLFSKITSGIRSVNWGGLLSNANKTLNVVNQTIPLVRQAGPMINNMKSMFRIAKAFGSETTNNRKNYNHRNTTNNNIINSNNINSNQINVNNNTYQDENTYQKKEIQSDTAPNFFI